MKKVNENNNKLNNNWFKDIVVYQIYPKSFYDFNNDGIGDLKGIEEKVDYLKYLGVDAIWFNPIYKSPQDDNGYDISDYYNIDEMFGNNEDLFRLLDIFHKNNIKILMDLVMNHTSYQHYWFQQALKGKDNPYRNYYVWAKPKNGKEPTNWKSIFGGSAWEFDPVSEEYYLHYFLKEQPDLNWKNQEVRDEFIKIIKFWLDKGVDGFRLDAVNVIGKPDKLEDFKNPDDIQNYHNYPITFDYLSEIYEKTFKKYNVFVMGEVAETTVDLANKITSSKKKCMDAVIHFEHMKIDRNENMERFEKRSVDVEKFKKIIKNWNTNLNEDAWTTWYWGNHDWDRAISRFGNVEEYYLESGKMLATILLTLKGTPIIYQGDEIGMTNCAFPSIDEIRDKESINYYKLNIEKENKDVLLDKIKSCSRDNSRTPFQWDNSDYAGFSKVKPWIMVNPNYLKINLKSQIDDNNSILNYYIKMIGIRKKYSNIINFGSFELMGENIKDLLIYKREINNSSMIVINNFSSNYKEINLHDLLNNYCYNNCEIIIANYKISLKKLLFEKKIKKLPPFYSAILFTKK